MAARAGVAEIGQRGDTLLLYSDVLGPNQLAALNEKLPGRARFDRTGRPCVALRLGRGENPLVLLRDAVSLLPGAAPAAGSS